MKSKIDFDCISQNELFIDLKLTNDEIKNNYLIIKKIIDMNNKCKNSNNNECPFDGLHLMLARNKFDKLEIITINCFNKSKKDKNNIKQNFLYSDINISKNKQLLNKKDIIVSNNDNDRIQLIKFLINIKKTNNLKSFYIYGPISSGKSYLAVALCNELAMINKKISIINMNTFVANISLIENDDVSLNQLVEKIKTSDVLLVDELGNETINKFSHFIILYPILIYRLENNLTTIFISNFSIDKLLKNYLLENTWKRNENQIRLFVNRIEKIVNKNIYKLSEKIIL